MMPNTRLILNPGEVGGILQVMGLGVGKCPMDTQKHNLKSFEKKRNTTQKGGATNLDDARTDLERKLRLHQHF